MTQVSVDETWYGEIEEGYIKESNGVKEILAPFTTKMIIKNVKHNCQYFDVNCLVTLLQDPSSNLSVRPVGLYSILASHKGENFTITIDANEHELEITNMSVPRNIDYMKSHIHPTIFPVYQYTENPSIVLIALMLILSFQKIKESVASNIFQSIEKLFDLIYPSEEYYLDILSILLLSIMKGCYWMGKSDILDSLIPSKTKELETRLNRLYKSKSEDLRYVDMSFGSLQKTNIESRIRNVNKLMNQYDDLALMVQKLKDDDMILELKFGINSYFLLQRNDNIYSFTINEYGTFKLVSVPDEVRTTYEEVAQKWQTSYETIMKYKSSLYGDVHY